MAAPSKPLKKSRVWVDPSKGETDLKPAKASQLRKGDLAKRIDGLRGMAWAYSLLLHTGWTASGVSAKFSGAGEGKEKSNSKIMYDYLLGKRAPIAGPRGRNKFDLVAEVELFDKKKVIAPWLFHPLWHVFNRSLPIYPNLGVPTKCPESLEFHFSFLNVGSEELEMIASQGTLPTIDNISDFVYVCSEFVRDYKKGEIAPRRWLLMYLIDVAAEKDRVFRMIREPFRAMINKEFPEPPPLPPEEYRKAIIRGYLQRSLDQ